MKKKNDSLEICLKIGLFYEKHIILVELNNIDVEFRLAIICGMVQSLICKNAGAKRRVSMLYSFLMRNIGINYYILISINRLFHLGIHISKGRCSII